MSPEVVKMIAGMIYRNGAKWTKSVLSREAWERFGKEVGFNEESMLFAFRREFKTREEIKAMYETKDSGNRQVFDSGMQRDVTDGKSRPDLTQDGPMFKRWAELLERGAKKYDARNWMKAKGSAEYARFRESAFRHFVQWWNGETDEDHAAAVYFNINGAEYLLPTGSPLTPQDLDTARHATREFMSGPKNGAADLSGTAIARAQFREQQARAMQQTLNVPEPFTEPRTDPSFTCYIAGPMTGLPEFNAPAFREAAKSLREIGWNVINPVELDEGKYDGKWADYLSRDLRFLLERRVSKVFTLPGWETSLGASIEVAVAKEMKIPVIHDSPFLKR